MPKFKFDYDQENDVMLVYKEGERSKGSVEIGESIILDFNDKGMLVAMELIGAASLLSRLGGVKVNKQELAGLREISFDVDSKASPAFVKLHVVLKNSELHPVLAIPIAEKSPALAH